MIIILGLGFTGRRLARRLLERGAEVAALVRDKSRFAELAAGGLRLNEVRHGLNDGISSQNEVVFYSIPPIFGPDAQEMKSLIAGLAPRRIVYISSTGVYGEQKEVDETTIPQPSDEKGRARLDAEAEIADGPWSTLILRAAAIYGPGRGVHVAIREGRLPRGAGSGVVSRIHAEDLAALAEAGLSADLAGAWPVADDTPSAGAEIAEWYGKRFGVGDVSASLGEFRVAGRRVNGRKIRELLGVELLYPTWEAGILASLAEEGGVK